MKTTVRKMLEISAVLNAPVVQNNGDKVFAIYCGAIRDEIEPHIKRHHAALRGSEKMDAYRQAVQAWKQENDGRSTATQEEKSAVSRELSELVKEHGVASEIAELDAEAERLADIEFEINVPKMNAQIVPIGMPNGVIQSLISFGVLPRDEAIAWAEKQNEKSPTVEALKPVKKGKK